MSETDIDEIGLAHNPRAIDLAPGQRRELRARAHHLNPVVNVGQHGLTPSVLHEIDVALTAHALIKVRVFNDERGEREAMLRAICGELGCAPVQHLGKLLILWRPQPESKVESTSAPEPRQAKRATKPGKKPARKPARETAAKAPAGRPSLKKPAKRAAHPSDEDAPRRRKPAVPRRARGQPLTAQDEPNRPPRSPKAPRATPATPKAPRGKRRAAVPEPVRGSAASPVTRMAPAIAARVPGRRSGGPAGVPRAPNPRRRRTK